MKELKKQFEGKGEVKGYNFTQVAFTASGYLYEVVCKKTKTSHFEVFRRKLNPRFGTVSYPSSKAFGLWAWTTRSKDRAQEILNSLT